MRFPKPERRKTQKAREKRDRNALIASVRRDVMQRDSSCRVCGQHPVTGLEMHEMTSRSQLAGRPSGEVFNTVNCIALCRDCHRDVTEKRLDLVPVSDRLGANSRVEAQRRIRT